MGTTLPANFQAELNKGINQPHIIVEVTKTDSTLLKFGFTTGGFSDVNPALKKATSSQNRLDVNKSFATRGQARFTIGGRDNFKNLIRDEYLKTRIVSFKVGYIADGFAYSDYAEFYSGDISDWNRKGDNLTITVSDSLAAHGEIELPILADATLLATALKYQNASPTDIILDMLLLKADRTTDISGVETLEIPVAQVDQANIIAQGDLWLSGVVFDRVLIEPTATNDLLNEIQREAGLFVFHNTEQIDCSVFAPLLPGVTVDTFTDTYNILKGSLTQNSGYMKGFYNRIVVYTDYNEEGGDNAGDFEFAAISADTNSQSSSNWNEVSTKVIKAKWIRSRTFTQPSSVTGVTIYHMSRANAVGSTSLLTWTVATSTLQWTTTGGAIGDAVEVTEDGRYELFDANNKAHIHVIVVFSDLDASNQSDNITITSLAGDTYAQTLANRTLRRFSNPIATVKWNSDINEVNNGTVLRKPGDFINMTTDEAFEFGENTWVAENVMLTSIRPDYLKGVIAFEAIETRFSGSSYQSKIGVISAGTPADYDAASDTEKEYGYISPLTGGDPDYVIW